ncbi:BZ3500_MvSof-1268-A1-R1_Chr9g10417 [Microbotryum saponariae]|uniref:BZ3500_MvSof-1268-A1-R1_Chr9g10417 protein n=1 Tax=Microbotryum saponariae TaxID=289078 RepID=A0A2X0KTF2_9BASI|nr:BZ3501_MvSof-1269-A2-R1_Chr9g10167 [Microbotryum saponariae]SDA00059.1 BZ3500_MvSof-1268-A1-R1_Chr9g10417 [Microbotryum saponariae]
MLDDDPRGDAKVDALGNLLGGESHRAGHEHRCDLTSHSVGAAGRQYKTKAFTSSMRPNPKKLYMFSIDTARAAGFRDSLYFFRRHPTVHKITIGQAEKDKLIAEGKLSLSMKSRIVTMVTARNVFKVLGAEFIKNGKYVFDDYYEDKALAEGHQPGEQASNDPVEPTEAETAAASASASAAAPATTTTSTSTSTKRSAPRDEYISIAGGGTTFGGIGLQPFAKTWDPTAKKARPPAHLNMEIWMLEYAKAVRRQDVELSNIRRANVGQVHLNPSGLIGDREEDAWLEVEEDVPSDEETAEERMDVGPERRRRVRVYNPLRGIYEPETNIPHVWKQTQATRSQTVVVDEVPHLWEIEAERQEPKRRRIESEAAKLGIATIETVVEEEGTLGRIGEDLLPGMWVFRTPELANVDLSRATK